MVSGQDYPVIANVGWVDGYIHYLTALRGKGVDPVRDRVVEYIRSLPMLDGWMGISSC